MIDISRKHPWSLNTESICPAFLDNPATKRLGNDNYWEIEINFDFLTKDENERIDLISLHPSNVGIFIYKNHIFLQLHQNFDGRTVFTKIPVIFDETSTISLLHTPYSKLEIKYQDKIIYTEFIKDTNLDYTPYRHVYIGSNTHNNSDSSSEPVIRVYNLKIKDEEEVLAEYTWGKEEYKDGRTLDVTGNNNILYEVG